MTTFTATGTESSDYVYDTWRIGLAAVIVGPIAAAIMIATNFKNQGHQEKFTSALLAGVGILVATQVFSLTVGQQIPTLLINVAMGGVCWGLAHNWQGRLVSRATENGATHPPFRTSLGVFAIGFVAAIALSIGVTMVVAPETFA